MIYQRLKILGLLATALTSLGFWGSVNSAKAQELQNLTGQRVIIEGQNTSFSSNGSRERRGILSVPSDSCKIMESHIDTFFGYTKMTKCSNQQARLNIEAKELWCESIGAKNRTRGRYPSGNFVAIEWISSLDGLSPRQRCEKGSASLQLNLIENKLGYLVISRDSRGRRAICASETSEVGFCEESKVVISLSDDDDANRVLYRFDQVVGSAKPHPIQVFRIISPDVVGKR
jgi:Circadian oscillating protein COP23